MGHELLGRIIEIVTGQDCYDYMQKNVFAPAGAKSASFLRAGRQSNTANPRRV